MRTVSSCSYIRTHTFVRVVVNPLRSGYTWRMRNKFPRGIMQILTANVCDRTYTNHYNNLAESSDTKHLPQSWQCWRHWQRPILCRESYDPYNTVMSVLYGPEIKRACNPQIQICVKMAQSPDHTHRHVSLSAAFPPARYDRVEWPWRKSSQRWQYPAGAWSPMHMRVLAWQGWWVDVLVRLDLPNRSRLRLTISSISGVEMRRSVIDEIESTYCPDVREVSQPGKRKEDTSLSPGDVMIAHFEWYQQTTLSTVPNNFRVYHLRIQRFLQQQLLQVKWTGPAHYGRTTHRSSSPITLSICHIWGFLLIHRAYKVTHQPLKLV